MTNLVFRYVQGDDAAWNAWLAARHGVPPYLAGGVANALHDIYGFEILRLLALRGEQAVGAVFAYFRPGTPGTRALYSPPDGVQFVDDETGKALLGELGRWCRDHGIVRSTLSTGQSQVETSYAAWTKMTLLKQLDAGEEAVWSGLRKKSRYTIRRTALSGLDIRSGIDQLTAFMACYSDRIVEKGLVPQRPEFFEALQSVFGDRMRVFVAWRDSQPMAGMIFLDGVGATSYRWNGARPEALAANVNHLLMWEAMRDTMRRTIPLMDMGESDPEGGTFAFKNVQFGAVPTLVHYVDVTRKLGQPPAPVPPAPVMLRVASMIARHLPGRFQARLLYPLKSFDRAW